MPWPWRRRLASPDDDPNVVRFRPSPGYGDHLMVAAVLEGLKRERPELRVQIAARHPEIFLHNPQVERVEDAHRLQRRRPEEYATYRWLRPRQPEERHLQVEGHLIEDLYRATGIEVRERPREPRIYLTERELEFGARRTRGLPSPRVAIVTYCKGSVRLPNKVYPGEQWDELACLLVKEAGTVLHLGSRKEGPLAPGASDFRDLGYRLTAAVLRHCDLLITHVSGLMHLAAAVRTPTLVLYGAAEHPAVSGYPWNRNLYVPIECGPCWMESPCSHHTCMRRLTPDIVMGEVRSLLQR
jgi:ADP-heptose:LPS heptosyltransferase